jgi:hypothetical protein
MPLERVNCTTMPPSAAQDIDKCTDERVTKRRRIDNTACSAVEHGCFNSGTVKSRHILCEQALLMSNESDIWGSQDTNELLPRVYCLDKSMERDSGYSSTISRLELENPISAEHSRETYQGSENAPAGDCELVCFGMVGFEIICNSIAVF